MWTCLDCGRSFANKNQWHACQMTTVDDVLIDQTDLATATYNAVVQALKRAGEFRVHPHKTRIAFISRMTFAGVSFARRWVDLSFILPTPLESQRVRRLELFGPTSWVHTVRLSHPAEVDDDVEGWLGAALTRGNQETLDPTAEVAPLSMSQLEIFWTGFRGRIEQSDDACTVPLPGHVDGALALIDEVDVRIAGVSQPTQIERRGEPSRLILDPGMSLGDGDEVDVFIQVGA